MLEMCEQECFSIETIVERACHAPARLFQVEERGFLREGYWADIVIVNPSQNTSVQESELYSKCQWSPFPHMTLQIQLKPQLFLVKLLTKTVN